MTTTELDEAIDLVKKSLITMSQDEVLEKVKEFLELDLNFEIDHNFAINISTSDKISNELFQKLVDIEFPDSFENWVKSKLRIKSDSFWVLLIEYLNFLVIKSQFPSECIPSFFISWVWMEHWVLTKHFSEMWTNVLGVTEDSMHFILPPTDREIFNSNYENTQKLYKKVFGEYPHNQIWRDCATEFKEFNQTRLNVNLERLVNYYAFEKDFMKENIWELSPLDPDISVENLADLYVLNHPYTLYNMREYSRVENIQENKRLRNESRDKSSINTYLWRAHYYNWINKNEANDIDEASHDAKVFSKGGFKYSLTNKYCISHYWKYSDEENHLLSLDDLADNSWESIHYYKDMSNEDINYNEYLLKGMESYKNMYSKLKFKS